MRAPAFAYVLMLVSATIAGCAGADEGTPTPTPSTTPTATATPPPPPAKPGTFSLTDVSSSPTTFFKITPNAFSAKLNETLNFTLQAPMMNQVNHHFIITEFGVAVNDLSPGATRNVQFNATRTGAFNYFCDVGNHRDLGMEGTLTIS